MTADVQQALAAVERALRIGDRDTDAWSAAWVAVDTLRSALATERARNPVRAHSDGTGAQADEKLPNGHTRKQE